MRSIAITFVTAVFLSACTSTATSVEGTVAAEKNQTEETQPTTKVCKDKPNTLGSRLKKQVCK